MSCLCSAPLDTALSPFCIDCRHDPARLQLVTELRTTIGELERQRDTAIRRAERAEAARSYWRRKHLTHLNPTLIVLEV